MNYIPGLNGLRAYAVFFVIFYHWGLPPLPYISVLKNLLPDGKFGVNLFFVISGFLISSILLIEKEKQLNNLHGKKKIIVNFYIRRFLRIFPIYYITIFAISFSNLPDFHKNLPYYLTYTENFNVYFKRSYDSFSHSWSLSVEEQFYLIWPFIILFLKKSWILKSLIFMVFLAPVFSIFQLYYFNVGYSEFLLTPSCFDALGMGALLAYFYSENNLQPVKKWIKILLPFSIVLFFYWKLAPTGGHFQYFKRFSDSIISSGAILFCLSKPKSLLLNKMLENKVMYHLGIISYAAYLFHYPLPYFYHKMKKTMGCSIGISHPVIDYTIMIIVLFTFAFLSYYFIEKPLLGLKTKFRY